jgi:hypothetical protein
MPALNSPKNFLVYAEMVLVDNPVMKFPSQYTLAQPIKNGTECKTFTGFNGFKSYVKAFDISIQSHIMVELETYKLPSNINITYCLDESKAYIKWPKRIQTNERLMQKIEEHLLLN